MPEVQTKTVKKKREQKHKAVTKQKHQLAKIKDQKTLPTMTVLDTI